MRKTFIILALLAFSGFANAQETDTWSINLGSQFYSKNTWSFYYDDPNSKDYRRLLANTTQFFFMQPSLRKYSGTTFTEIGFRHTGFTNNSSYLSNIDNGLTPLNTVSLEQQNASIGFYYGKSALLLGGSKLGLWLGGDANGILNYANARFNDIDDYDAGFEVRETAFTLGIGLTPRMQYEVGKRLILDFAINLQTISYSLMNEQTLFNDVLEVQNQNSGLFSLGFTGSPQLSIGIKL